MCGYYSITGAFQAGFGKETHVAAQNGVRRQSAAAATLSADRARSLVQAFNRQFDAQSGVALRLPRRSGAKAGATALQGIVGDKSRSARLQD